MNSVIEYQEMERDFLNIEIERKLNECKAAAFDRLLGALKTCSGEWKLSINVIVDNMEHILREEVNKAAPKPAHDPEDRSEKDALWERD